MNKCEICRCNKICDHNLFGFEICDNFISEDVVEVVRCKSCVHYQNGACNHFGYYTYAPDVDEDDFCSYGERKVE
jgi:hypothetical protein